MYISISIYRYTYIYIDIDIHIYVSWTDSSYYSQSDFLALNGATAASLGVGPFDAAFDRGALVAIKPEDRERYAEVIYPYMYICVYVYICIYIYVCVCVCIDITYI